MRYIREHRKACHIGLVTADVAVTGGLVETDLLIVIFANDLRHTVVLVGAVLVLVKAVDCAGDDEIKSHFLFHIHQSLMIGKRDDRSLESLALPQVTRNRAMTALMFRVISLFLFIVIFIRCCFSFVERCSCRSALYTAGKKKCCILVKNFLTH